MVTRLIVHRVLPSNPLSSSPEDHYCPAKFWWITPSNWIVLFIDIIFHFRFEFPYLRTVTPSKDGVQKSLKKSWIPAQKRCRNDEARYITIAAGPKERSDLHVFYKFVRSIYLVNNQSYRILQVLLSKPLRRIVLVSIWMCKKFTRAVVPEDICGSPSFLKETGCYTLSFRKSCPTYKHRGQP